MWEVFFLFYTTITPPRSSMLTVTLAWLLLKSIKVKTYFTYVNTLTWFFFLKLKYNIRVVKVVTDVMFHFIETDWTQSPPTLSGEEQQQLRTHALQLFVFPIVWSALLLFIFPCHVAFSCSALFLVFNSLIKWDVSFDYILFTISRLWKHDFHLKCFFSIYYFLLVIITTAVSVW